MLPKVSITELAARAARGERLVMITAYDAPSARLAESAHIDVILVGDSAGMTVLGASSTMQVTLDEMIVFTRAASRGTTRALLVADMPFGSYQVSDESAVASAVRLIKEGGADAVKLEGAGPSVSRVRALVDAGIAVMGHVGLTPQSATQLGGFKTQGKTADAAGRILDEAIALERAGCFAIVLEAMPAVVAERIVAAVGVPTFGIGAGPACPGQVLVWHDVMGLLPGPPPRFVKQYAHLHETMRAAIEAFAQDVRSRAFPDTSHTYAMPDEEVKKLR